MDNIVDEIFSGNVNADDVQDVEEVKQEAKEDKKPTKQEESVKTQEEKEDWGAKYISLEKQFKDTKKWGHEKNKQLLHARKKASSKIQELVEAGALEDQDAQNILKGFSEALVDSESEEVQSKNEYQILQEKLDAEFKVFKKYNKDDTLDAKYRAYYDFFPMLTPKEQAEAKEYIKDNDADVALDYVITKGEELYNSLYKNAKSGNVVKYVTELQSNLTKLQTENEKLKQELDGKLTKSHNIKENSSNTANTHYDRTGLSEVIASMM